MSSKTNARVAVSAAQRVDVVVGRREGFRVCVPSAWLSSFCKVQDLLLTCLQQFLKQAAPAAEVDV